MVLMVVSTVSASETVVVATSVSVPAGTISVETRVDAAGVIVTIKVSVVSEPEMVVVPRRVSVPLGTTSVETTV